MNVGEEVVENRNKIKINELRIKALINMLSKEGIVTEEEVEDELSRLVQETKNEEK